MPRKGCPARRKQTGDARFGDVQVSSVISKVMWDGKKTIAEKIVYGAMEHAAKRLKSEPLVVLHKALEIVKPLVEVKSRRVGGATYQVPIEVSEARQRSLAVRWLVNYARGRSEFTMEEKLGNEIADAVQERGNAFKKREDTHRMAEANKAFSHYRW